MPKIEDPYAAGVRAARLTLFLNLLLCLSKVIVGWTGNSFALIADGINNLTDVGISAALFMGLRLAQRPPDKHHPYGHGKIEQELIRIVAIVVLVTGGGIIWEAIKRLSRQEEPPDALVLVIAILAIGVKIFMYSYQNKVARQTRSSALAADALNHKSDIAATSCVLLGASVVRLGGPAWALADQLAAIVIGIMIVLVAGREIYRASSELLDKGPPGELIDHIRTLAAEYPDIRGVDLITGRKTGMHYLIDLHLEVAGDMPVRQAHFLGHKVKDWLMSAIPQIVDIIVHIEPEEQNWKI